MLQTNDDRWPMWDHRFGGNDDDEANKASNKGRKQGEQQFVDKKVDKSLEKKTPANIKPKSSKATGTGLGSSDMSRGQFMKLTSIGTELLAAVLVGTFIGWAINRLFGNKYPWIIAIGVIVGAMAGLLNIYRLIIEEEEKDKQQRERQREEQDKGASSR